jgi:cellulose synthase/poly-beta-1,6-N-acetylglucosamine synthase-like glycosyltransferase
MIAVRALMPHFLDDDRMGLVCPPQTFYDLPTNDPLTQTMDHFAGMTEVVNDALGHADCLGSGYLARRAALEDIGGFPTESLSEDVCCSATLLGAGWKTTYIPERLQNGLVPETLFAHIKQRTRWFVGHIQTAWLFKMRLFSRRSRHLTVMQRIVGISFDLGQLLQVPLVVGYIIVPLSLWQSYPLVAFSSREELRLLIW